MLPAFNKRLNFLGEENMETENIISSSKKGDDDQKVLEESRRKHFGRVNEKKLTIS